MRFLEALRNSVQRLEAGLADSGLFDHKGDRGEFREEVVGSFLRPFLPPCYGLGSGAVFAADGTGSRQMDVILYDAVFSNVLFPNSSSMLFPAESVFGVIEVKSELSSIELQNAIDNIKSLKCLPRQPSDMLDVLPFRRIPVGGTLKHDQTVRNPYLGICFAFNGLSGETVRDSLNRDLPTTVADREMLPNYVFNYRKGYFICRCTKENMVFSPTRVGQPYDRFVMVKTGSDTLPIFFLTVNGTLNGIILRAPDFGAYWSQVLAETQKSVKHQ